MKRKIMISIKHLYEKFNLEMIGQKANDIVNQFSIQLQYKSCVLGSVLIAIIAPFFPWSLPNWLGVNYYSAVWILAGFAGISVTLIALLFAVTTFRAQYLATRLPSQLVGDVFSTSWHKSALWRLGAILVASIIALGPITDPYTPNSITNVLFINLLLLLLTVYEIQRGVSNIFGKKYSIGTVAITLRYIDDEYLFTASTRRSRIAHSMASGVITDFTDPFSLIEQVCVRSMKDGDLTTAHLLLRAVKEKVLTFVKKQEDCNSKALEWLGDLLSIIGRKALIDDERTAELIVLLFEDLLNETFEIKCKWHERIKLLNSFREIRHSAIRVRKIAVLTRALYAISRIFEKSLAAAPAETALKSLYRNDSDAPQHNSEAEIEWNHVRDSWMQELRQDLELIIAEDIPDAFYSGMWIHRSMGFAIKDSSYLGIRQKKELLRWLIWQSKDLVLTALKKGRNESYVRWEFEYPGEFDTSETPGISDQILSELSEIMIEASKEGKLQWRMLNVLASNGRGYAKNEDDRAIFIAETFGALAAPLSQKSNLEMRTRYLEAASALRSLAKWDNRKTSLLKDIVRQELEKFKHESEWLDAWRSYLPSRRRIPAGQFHSEPWA